MTPQDKYQDKYQDKCQDKYQNKPPYEFFATVALGMEDLLAEELLSLGAQQVKKSRAGVAFWGSLETGYRACLWSRVANRVLLPLQSFDAPDPHRLYAGVRSIHWSDHLTAQQTLAVDFAASRSKITHTHFGALKVKDAIVDQFRTIQGSRPSIDPVRPDLRVNVYLHQDRATVSIDLSGESLHRREYRKEGVEAPLKETLAAAILKLAGWPKGETLPFLDPMCGSGTLPIEAAWMAGNIAPGLRRNYFGFLGWLGHVPRLWKRLLSEAEEVQIRDPRKFPKIVGYDIDGLAIKIALSNVERAGMRGKVHLEKRALSLLSPLGSQGILVANPPYGERLGEAQKLEPLYQELGDILKQQFKGWEGYVFTGNPDLAKSIGLKAQRRFVLFNGPIECRLLKYELY